MQAWSLLIKIVIYWNLTDDNMRYLFKILPIAIFSFFISGCFVAPKMVIYDDVCKFMSDRISWYKILKETEIKYKVDKSLILAFIKQESSFNASAMPKAQQGFFSLFGKKEGAYGFAQAKLATWNEYQQATKNSAAKRNNFADSSDFIAWYVSKSNKLLGIDSNDAYNQYLAYHEGRGGFSRESYKQKPWLVKVAKKVFMSARNYKEELISCSRELDSTYSWSYF